MLKNKSVGNILPNIIISKILGTRIQGKLIVTNLRAIIQKETIEFYCVPVSTEIKLLTKRSIQEIGYELKKTCFFFCPTYYLYYVGKDHTFYITVPTDSEAKVNEILNKFYNVIN